MNLEHFQIDEIPFPTSGGYFPDSTGNLPVDLKEAVNQFNSFHGCTPTTIVTNTFWAMKIQSALIEARLILEICCENDFEKNQYSLVRFPPSPDDGEDNIQVEFSNIKHQYAA